MLVRRLSHSSARFAAGMMETLMGCSDLFVKMDESGIT